MTDTYEGPDGSMPTWYPTSSYRKKQPNGKNPFGEPLTADGQHNLKWWAWELARVQSYAIEMLESGNEKRFDPQKYTKHLVEQMKARGINLAEMGSNKADLLIIDHPEEWFEQSEGTLKRMREEAKRIIDMSKKSDLEALDLITDLSEVQLEKLKRAVKIIDGVIALQKFCREVNPSKELCLEVSKPVCYLGLGSRPETAKDNDSMRYLRPMRVMLYVMRSTSSWKGLAEWDTIMDMGKHLALASITIERAREKGCHGAMIEMAPGHGKTNIGIAVLATWLSDNPEANTGILHHKSEMASDRLVALREMMTPDNPTGRRYCALFPQVRMPYVGKPSSTEFTLNRRSGSKDPTCRSFGISEAVQGSDLHFILSDDIVDAKERDEETTRKRTYNSFVGNFLPRMRGDKTFFVMVYTPWHLDDAHGRIKRGRRIMENGLADIALLRLPCGTESDEFAPIWPRISREKLKTIKRRLGNTALWECLYRLNPVSEKMRIVKNLHYVEHDTENAATQEFLATSRMVLSIDPTATVGKKSDKAGIVYAAVNEMLPQIRIIEAFEVAAIQMDLAAFVSELTATREVHEIVVETIGGHHATADALEHDYGFPTEMVVRVGTKNKSKDVRLRSVAIHLENGKIAFVGEKDDDGKIVPKPEHDWMYSQILKFGATDQDHVVDAITQLAIRYAASLWTGEDFKTDEQKRLVDDSKRFYRNGRMYQHYKRIMRLRHHNCSHVTACLMNADVERDVEDFAWNN